MFTRTAPVALTLLTAALSPLAASAPTQPQVVGGTQSATVSVEGRTTHVTQLADRAVINWRTFNVAKDEKVTFLQPNASLCPGTCGRELLINGGNLDALPDRDMDGMRDCVEQALGSNSQRADSDGDNFIDSLEVRFGTNFNDPSTLNADSDRDGVSDAQEIITGTDPHSAEPNRDMA